MLRTIMIVLAVLIPCFAYYSCEKDSCLLKKKKDFLSFTYYLKDEVIIFKTPISTVLKNFQSQNFKNISAETLPGFADEVMGDAKIGKLICEIMSSDHARVSERCERLCAATERMYEKEYERTKEKRTVRLTFSVFIGSLLIILFL